MIFVAPVVVFAAGAGVDDPLLVIVKLADVMEVKGVDVNSRV